MSIFIVIWPWVPIVVSQNFSSATSLAMLAPIRTVMVMPSFSLMTSEISLRPFGPTSTPCWRDLTVKLALKHQRTSVIQLMAGDFTLMRDMPTASFLMWSLMVSHTLTMNWCGTTKMRMSAPFTDSARSGTANWRGQEERQDERVNELVTFTKKKFDKVFYPYLNSECPIH